jgi:nicotinate-nucleotide adenylyltransferase
VSVGVYGGSFDPPHRGHVALARRAKEELGLGQLRVLVSEDPGHKEIETPAEVRLELARAAFPGDVVELDPSRRTVDMLRAHPEWRDPIFLIGADEFCDFPSWKEPDEVLNRTRLAVATRLGFPRDRLESVLATVAHPERVLFFELDPVPLASTDLRARLEAGEDVSADLPGAVASLIRERGLYARPAGYTGRA